MTTHRQQDWVEQIAACIPGYRGYVDKERRRDVDKAYREHLAGQLQRMKAALTAVTRELSETGRLFETKPLERVTGKLDKLENRIRYASYGYTGFFDAIKVREAELDRLYQFDLGLAGDVEAIKTKVGAITANDEAAALKAGVSTLESALDRLDARFSERHKAIESNW